MDEVSYEKSIRKKACLTDVLLILFFNIWYLFECGLHYILQEFEMIFMGNLFLLVIFIFEYAFKTFFRIAGTIKTVVSLCALIFIILTVIEEHNYSVFLREEVIVPVITVICLFQFFYYNIMMIKYNKQNLELKEKNEYKLQLSRKLCNLLAIRQIVCVILIMQPNEVIRRNFFFHMEENYSGYVFLAFCIIASTAAIIPEWKYNELYEFIETGCFAVLVAPTPWYIAVVFSLLLNEKLYAVLSLPVCWLISIIMFVLYRKGIKNYERKEYYLTHEEKTPEEPEKEVTLM